MDRNFLSYYETELTHLRQLATEFAGLHPTVARNLSLDVTPCPDPYIERLLEGVAFLGARTRHKLDFEGSRHVRTLLDALYPDLAAPAPAMTLAELQPSPQVGGMLTGHTVRRGTKLLASLREGLSTRAVYTTAQPVDLWPVRIVEAEYIQDRSALGALGVADRTMAKAEAGLRFVIERTGGMPLAELSLDRLDLFLGNGGKGNELLDAILGWGRAAVARPAGKGEAFRSVGTPATVGFRDDEAVLPRVRNSFEGYRLLREYFLMPQRFQFVRLTGLATVVRAAQASRMEVVILLDSPRNGLSGVSASDFALGVTPIVNLFERECNIVELSRGRTSHVVHVDRTRPRDFEIYRLLRVENADESGLGSQLVDLYSLDQRRGTQLVYATDRRPRRPMTDETVAGQLRTSYAGDDFFISVARPPGARDAVDVKRLDIRALCTNRDVPILDDTPRLSLGSGDPVSAVRLVEAVRRPRASLSARLPGSGRDERETDDLTWRWIAQLSLSQLCISEEGAKPLQRLIDLYADRGDPAYARHGRSVSNVEARPIVDRVVKPGPICFAHGSEITLTVDEGVLTGGSKLLLSALISRLLARDAAINSFVRTKTRLMVEQEEVVWPTTVGTRDLI